MTIKLSDFFKYYAEESQQKAAIDLLESQMPASLLQDDSGWVALFRSKPEPPPSTEQSIGTKGFQLIKDFEGVRLAAYPDPGTGGDPWTIGYGHTGSEVKPGLKITQQQAESYLASDLQRFEADVARLISVDLNQDEFDACVSFTFNVGPGNLQSSTFRRRMNAGDDKPTCFKEEFPKWVNGGNGPMPGLVRRRDAEVKLAVTGQYP